MIYIISINLITGIIILLLGNRIGEKGGIRIINRVFTISLIILIYYIYKIIYKGEERREHIGIWYNDISKELDISIIIDKISIIMTSLIVIISYIIMKYSIWYIPELKFKGYLYIFLVSMIILVSSKELLSIYIGWEWVGISSYILINYWYNNIYNNKAGIKALLYNKIGDIAIILLLVHIYNIYNNTYSNILEYKNIGYIIGIYIGIGSIVKSAQYIMHPWLGDAMAGPTPVSALLHAATMVTAGIILLARTIIYSSNIWDYILYMGLITIILGGISSIVQNDIKKVIAFSTCSQLGYMYYIIIYNNIPINYSIYHLYTHAFFKALLFLMAGIIIHYASNEQDLRRIKLSSNNFIYPLLLFSCLSLLSFPYTSGYYSKESIILSINNIYIWILSIIGALLTSIYTIILIYKLYMMRLPNITPISHFPLKLYIVLLPLLIGSIFLGYFSYSYFLSLFQYLISFNPYLILLPLFSIFLIFFLYSYIYIYGIGYFVAKIGYYIYILFNNISYIDNIVNYVSYYFLSIPYSLYLNIDKGILEYIGPLGIYKLFIYNNIYILSTYSKLNILLSFSITLLISIILLYI